MSEQRAWSATVEKLTIYTHNRILRYRALQAASAEGRRRREDAASDAELAKEVALNALRQVLDSEMHWDQDQSNLFSVLKQAVDRDLKQRFGREERSAGELLKSIEDSISGEADLVSVFRELTAGREPDAIAEALGISRRRVLELIRELKRRVEKV